MDEQGSQHRRLRMLKRLLTKKIWLSAVIAFVAIAVIVGLLLGPKPQPDVTATVESTKVITLEPSATPKLVAALESPTEYDFEDGTTQGWVPRGEASVSVATDVVHSGSYSLLTTDRKAEWAGATVDVMGMLKEGSSYEISAYMRLAEGEPDSRVVITMQRTPVGGGTKYEWIAPSAEKGVTDAEWVYLQGQYSYSGEVSELLLYVESPDAALVDFYVDDITITRTSGPSAQVDIPSVYETLSAYFVVGAAITPDLIDEEQHNILMTRHFSSLTVENAMKPGSIQPSEGEFRWAGPDKLVQYARENDKAIHGHTLVWHQQAAEWMFEDSEGNPLAATPENKELVLQRLETHIRAVVGRYKDDVHIWDVVNEVIDPGNSDCMRRTKWYDLTGTDYIVTAFQVADEVAPDAVLLINDYGTTEPRKRTCLYNVVSDLQAQGVPVDGVGHQMHITIGAPSAEVIEDTILMFAELGVEQHITELDMSIYTNDTDSYTTVPDEILVRQGKRYKAVFDVFKRQADHIQSVTFWGLADDRTWLKTFPIARINLPLLFDEQLQAKPAYWGVVDPTKLPVAVQRMTIAAGTPTIDGYPEIVWTMQSWIRLKATAPLRVNFQTLWDEDYLYLYVDVEGSTLDSGDKIEVFIDENNAKTAAYEDDDVHYTCQDGVCTPSDGVVYAVQAKEGGYGLEVAFPLDTAATIGGEIGFDLRITGGSQPDTPYSWSDPTYSQDTSTTNFGTLELAEAVRLTVAVRGTPVIDGNEDAVWADAVEDETAVWVVGESGATARVKTLWDDEHLYVLAVVSDSLLSKASSNAWEQDSFEVFVDQNNAKTSWYQVDDGQYRINFDNEQSFNGAAAPELITSATRIVPGGYVVELAIKLDAVTPQEGVQIGFDFQVNDDKDGDGVRDSVVTWNDPTHQSYQNTSRLGVLLFVEQAE